MSVALILAGAIGNMIDSAFYGMIFSHSFGQTASFMQGGYAGFLQKCSGYVLFSNYQ